MSAPFKIFINFGIWARGVLILGGLCNRGKGLHTHTHTYIHAYMHAYIHTHV